jgi:hypothetical protein
MAGDANLGALLHAACPPKAFRAAALTISALLPGALEKVGGIDRTCATYNASWASIPAYRCNSEPWPMVPRAPGHGLLLNAGAGTTGTRFISCVIGRSTTLKVVHEGTRETLQRPWVDFMSDSPVPYELARILAAHKHKRSAGVLLSLRDPFEWLAKRTTVHASSHCCSVPTMPCGNGIRITSPSNAEYAHHFYAYQAWAACLATSPKLGFDKQHLFAFNLFAQRPANLTSRFYSTLRRFAGNRIRDGATFWRAWARCR